MEDLFNSSKVVGIGRRVDVVGDDDSGRSVGLIDRPTFCAGSTEDEIERAHNGDQSVFVVDLARHKDATNPQQCEIARLYDLATDRWYRESPYSLGKNLAAGIVNAVVPGSNLGDERSSTQIVGQLVGTAAGFFFNPSQVISKVANMSLGTTIGNAFNFVNKAFSGPIGAIASNVVGTLLSPTPVSAQVQSQVLNSPKPANITDNPMTYAQKAVFGGVTVGGTTISTTKPWYQNPIVWVVGAVLAAVVGFFFFKRKRR